MRNKFCLLLSAIVTLSIAHSTQAQIATDGSTATQVNGNAIAPTGAGTVNGGNLYHSFSEFNVQQTGVIFNTGNSAVNGADVRNIINRVTGDNPSAILGTIESRQAFPNANLYLMNPNGIVFGQNARLDIGGSFHTTTGTGFGFDNGIFNVDKNSLSFPSGDPKTIRFAIAQPAGIINQGNLAVDAGKSITFTGGSIINTGTLTAPSGNVALTAVAGNSLVELRSPDAVLGLQVTNHAVPANWNGMITELPKLAELLTGKVPEANQVVVKADGSLALVASPAANDIAVTNGMAIVSGKVDVSSQDLKAGNVGIFGEKVGLVNAQIDASGALGGGTVLIGGNFQGNGIAPNALRTFVSSSSKIDVRSLLRGNAGTAIVWADQSTRFLGEIIAKGGTLSGDGGFVEVSGKENLIFDGKVDVRAVNGNVGTLLLDPTDITISTAANTPTINFAGGVFSDVTTNPSNLNVTTLQNQLVLSNVTISTASGLGGLGDITINSPLTLTGTNSLTLQANNDINLNATIVSVGGGGSLILNAGRNFNGASQTIGSSTRNISINAATGNITTGDLNANISSDLNTNAGNITLTAPNGNITTADLRTRVSLIVAGNAGNGGTIAITSGGTINTGFIQTILRTKLESNSAVGSPKKERMKENI